MSGWIQEARKDWEDRPRREAGLTVECAWCGRIMKPGCRTAPVSHGCCEECLVRLKQKMEGQLGPIEETDPVGETWSERLGGDWRDLCEPGPRPMEGAGAILWPAILIFPLGPLVAWVIWRVCQ